MPEVTVYILCGLPFAGKTTLARALSQEMGLAHVEVDAIARNLGARREGKPVTEAEWEQAFAESYGRVAKWLKQGQSVVYDATNFDRAARDRVRNVARQYGARARVLYVSTDIAEADRRRQGNRLALERDDVPDTAFWEIRDLLEVPTAHEDVVVYDGTTPFTQWVVEELAKGKGQ